MTLRVSLVLATFFIGHICKVVNLPSLDIADQPIRLSAEWKIIPSLCLSLVPAVYLGAPSYSRPVLSQAKPPWNHITSHLLNPYVRILSPWKPRNTKETNPSAVESETPADTGEYLNSIQYSLLIHCFFTASCKCHVENFFISSGRYIIRPDELLYSPDDIVLRPGNIVIRRDELIYHPDYIQNFSSQGTYGRRSY